MCKPLTYVLTVATPSASAPANLSSGSKRQRDTTENDEQGPSLNDTQMSATHNTNQQRTDASEGSASKGRLLKENDIHRPKPMVQTAMYAAQMLSAKKITRNCAFGMLTQGSN
jgi:hypothetical protein